jgi:hypothetical protein
MSNKAIAGVSVGEAGWMRSPKIDDERALRDARLGDCRALIVAGP